MMSEGMSKGEVMREGMSKGGEKGEGREVMSERMSKGEGREVTHTITVTPAHHKEISGRRGLSLSEESLALCHRAHWLMPAHGHTVPS